MSENPIMTATRTDNPLALRRSQLGMSAAVIAARSGVSVATVRRILAGHLGEASFANVSAVADALGAPLQLQAGDPHEFRQHEARRKAERLARLVQGTSALEGQAVGSDAYRRIVERSYHELLAGPARRLWAP